MKKLSTNLKTTELAQFVTSTVQLFSLNSELKDDEILVNMLNEIETLGNRLSIAIKSDKTESNLAELDLIRDNYISAIFNLIKGYTYHPAEIIKSSAVKIQKICEKYKRINKESYRVESALVESLLTDFKSETSAIKNLNGVEELINELYKSEDNLKKAMATYTQDKSNKQESASSLKKPLLSLINDKLIAFLNLAILSEKYKQFATLIETEITKVNADVQKRITKKVVENN